MIGVWVLSSPRETMETMNIPQHKGNLQQTTDNINLNGKLRAFLLKSGTIQRCLLSLYLLSILPDVLARKIKQLKEITGMQAGRKKAKVLIFIDYKIFYIKYSKDSTKKFL